MTGLEAALALASAGFHVFPCRPGRKVPATEHGLTEATDDGAIVAGWWGKMPAANVAIATGPSRLAVIDLDGGEGIAAWRKLYAEHPDTPRTLMVRTPRGGWHLYYRARPDRPLRSTAGQLAGHIDTRGRGGYVVSPPSQVDGRRYEWATDQIPCLPVVPGWVLDRLEPRPASFHLGGGERMRPSPAGGGPLPGLARTVLAAPVGQRNSCLNWAAYAAAKHVQVGRIPVEEAASVLYDAALQVGLGHAEAVRTIASGLGSSRTPG